MNMCYYRCVLPAGTQTARFLLYIRGNVAEIFIQAELGNVHHLLSSVAQVGGN